MRATGFSLATAALLGAATLASANYTDPNVLDACPGYKATGVSTVGPKLTANLVLAGKACNVYGKDIEKLKLEVTYETSESALYCSSMLFSADLVPYRHEDSRQDHGPLL